MSSGISTDAGRLKPASTDAVEAVSVEARSSRPPGGASRPRDGLQAWHFFVLASILLATVTVFVTRRSAPEHLILISLTVAAAGAVAGACYRMLLPLFSTIPSVGEERLSERRRATLDRDKMLTLRAIKEMEFDRAMGKLSQKDFDEMSSRLRHRAVTLMRELDQGGYAAVIEKELRDRLRDSPGPAAAIGSCGCGTLNDGDAVFCKTCGTRLQVL
jgi:hypothetical protein